MAPLWRGFATPQWGMPSDLNVARLMQLDTSTGAAFRGIFGGQARRMAFYVLFCSSRADTAASPGANSFFLSMASDQSIIKTCAASVICSHSPEQCSGHKLQTTNGENHVNGSKVSILGRRTYARTRWRHIERKLVAQSTERKAAQPELSPVQSHGEGVQLR